MYKWVSQIDLHSDPNTFIVGIMKITFKSVYTIIEALKERKEDLFELGQLNGIQRTFKCRSILFVGLGKDEYSIKDYSQSFESIQTIQT